MSLVLLVRPTHSSIMGELEPVNFLECQFYFPYTKAQRNLLSPVCSWLSFLKLLFLKQAVLKVKRFYSNYKETQPFLSYSSLLLNLAMQRQVLSTLIAFTVNIYHTPFCKLCNFAVLPYFY